MKSQGLAELVKKIFGDEKTRQEFERDPGSILAKYDLSEEEKRAVMTTHTRFGLVSSGSGQLAATLKGTSGWWSPAP